MVGDGDHHELSGPPLPGSARTEMYAEEYTHQRPALRSHALIAVAAAFVAALAIVVLMAFLGVPPFDRTVSHTVFAPPVTVTQTTTKTATTTITATATITAPAPNPTSEMTSSATPEAITQQLNVDDVCQQLNLGSVAEQDPDSPIGLGCAPADVLLDQSDLDQYCAQYVGVGLVAVPDSSSPNAWDCVQQNLPVLALGTRPNSTTSWGSS